MLFLGIMSTAINRIKEPVRENAKSISYYGALDKITVFVKGMW